MATKLIELKILVKVFTENDYFIAYSPELQISTQGKTVEEVKKRFSERLDIFFSIALEKDNLHERLRSLGWVIQEKNPKKLIPPENFQVPRNLLMAQQCTSEQFSYSI